jgi:hypothetical protein
MRNLRFTGDLKAMPPGGCRGKKKEKRGLKYRDTKRRTGIIKNAAKKNKGLSKPRLTGPPRR